MEKTYQKLIQKWEEFLMENSNKKRLKIDQKSMKNRSKINPKIDGG